MSNYSIERSVIIKWMITIALALIPAFIPEEGIYTQQLKLFLIITIFGLALAAFELVHVLLISIVMPSCWILFQVAPASVVMSPWVGTTFIMMVGALFMATSLEQCGLLKRIAYFLIQKVNGNWLSMLFAIMIVTVLLNIITYGRGWLIMAALAAGLCLSLDGMQKNIGAGLAMAVMIGGCTSHSYTYYATSWAVLTKMGGEYLGTNAITPFTMLMHNWPLFIVSCLILFVVVKLYKPERDLSDATFFEQELKAMGKITRAEKSNALMLIVMLVFVATVSLHNLDINLGFAIIPWIVFLPGFEGADEKTVKNMNFSTLFFAAACMGIGTVATSLGLGEAIAEVCRTLLNGSTSPILIMAIVFALVFGLNFLMTPMAIYALILAPILIMVTGMGYSPIPFAYAINACSEAIIFPYEYIPYLIVFSFGMISMKDFIKANIIRSAMFFAGFLFVLVPYWMLIGLL